MIRRIAGSVGSPKVSYSITMPLLVSTCTATPFQSPLAKVNGFERRPLLPRRAIARLPCQPWRHVVKLNLMVQHRGAPLDAAFVALADPTRRGVLEQLGRSEASITELAGRFQMTLTGMKK